MCILIIRTWPECRHSRCTSTDICMDALSTPGRTPYDCPRATHSFSSTTTQDWPCPVCTRRQQPHDPGHQPASMSPRKLQQQVLRLQRQAQAAAQQEQTQRHADLRRASLQLQMDRREIGLPDPFTTTEGIDLAFRPGRAHARQDSEDLISLSSGSGSASSPPTSPTTPTSPGSHPLWSGSRQEDSKFDGIRRHVGSSRYAEA